MQRTHKLAMLLVAGLLMSSSGRAQSRWRGMLAALGGGGADASTGSIVGMWHGGKTENDPVRGGYLNLEFSFDFRSDGTYQEAAYIGSRQVMLASGTYQVTAASKRDDPSVSGLLSFTPTRCQFASDALAELVRFFPIPTGRSAQEYIGVSALAGGGQMTLEDASRGGDSWGLKPVR